MAKEELYALLSVFALFLLFSAFNIRNPANGPTGEAITDSLPFPISNNVIIAGMLISTAVIIILVVVILQAKRRHSGLVEKKKRFIPSMQSEKKKDKQDEEIDKLFTQDIEKYVKGGDFGTQKTEPNKPKEATEKRPDDFFIKEDEKKTETSPPQLLDYIKKAKEKNIDKKQVIANLLQTGWKKEQVEAAFRELNKKRLQEYVAFALKNHQTEEQIIESLFQAGWMQEEIEKELDMAKTKMAFGN